MPLLSVVVPTHNRAQYAKSCIEAVLGFDTPDLQLVMTDTSTDNQLYNWLHDDAHAHLRDPRFVYRRIEGPSDVTKNHNNAFALATGEYVGVVGDDDCITGAALDAVRWASSHGCPAVTQTLSATYAWPDFRSRLGRGGHSGRLYVPRDSGGGRWRDADADLRRGLARAFQGTEDLPRTYHGFVRRDVFEEVRHRTGEYVHGSSPDMSGAIAMACRIERYFEVDIPLSIPGISGGSNSGRSALDTHKGDLSSDTQTSRFKDKGWPLGVPRFFAVETVWAHAGLATVGMLRPDLLPRFNYARLLALCWLRHPEYRPQIDDATSEAKELLGYDIVPAVTLEIRLERSARRRYLLRRMMNPTAANGRRYFGGIPDVAAASRRYEEYAYSQGLSFEGSAQVTGRRASGPAHGARSKK